MKRFILLVLCVISVPAVCSAMNLEGRMCGPGGCMQPSGPAPFSSPTVSPRPLPPAPPMCGPGPCPPVAMMCGPRAQVSAYGKVGYEGMNFNYDFPIPTPRPGTAPQFPVQLDFNNNRLIWIAGGEVKLAGMLGYVEAAGRGESDFTATTSPDPFFTARSVKWKSQRPEWFSYDAGGGIEVYPCVSLIGGVVIEHLDVGLRRSNAALNPRVTADYYADLQVKHWTAYAGARLDTCGFKARALVGPWARVNLSMPFRVPTVIGRQGLAGASEVYCKMNQPGVYFKAEAQVELCKLWEMKIDTWARFDSLWVQYDGSQRYTESVLGDTLLTNDVVHTATLRRRAASGGLSAELAF